MKFVMRLFIACLLIAQSPAYSQIYHQCLKSIKELFSENVSPEDMQRFLKLQGKITMHKLAWAHLKQSDPNGEVKGNLEDSIMDLLSQYETKDDPKFIKVKKEFELNKLSRTALANAIPYVKDVLMKQMKDPSMKDKVFMLNSSDIKMLSILAEKEKNDITKTVTVGDDEVKVYNNKLYTDKNNDRSILNFTKVINSSYKNQRTNKSVKFNTEVVNRKLDKLTYELNEIIGGLPTPEICRANGLLCNIDALAEETLNIHILENDNIMDALYAQATKSLDAHLHDNLKYGKIWLHVKGMPAKEKADWQEGLKKLNLKEVAKICKGKNLSYAVRNYLCKDAKRLVTGNTGETDIDEKIMAFYGEGMEDLYRGVVDSEVGTFLKENMSSNTRQGINDYYHDGLRDSGIYRLASYEELAKGNVDRYVDNNLRATENSIRETGQAAATLMFGKNSTAYNVTRDTYHAVVDPAKDAYNWLARWF